MLPYFLYSPFGIKRTLISIKKKGKKKRQKKKEKEKMFVYTQFAYRV